MCTWLGLNEVPVIPNGNYGIMGILNLTPDSFYDGGRYDNCYLAYAHFEEMISQGADIIDIGAESSRPGAELTTKTNCMTNNQETEWNRLAPFLKLLSNKRNTEKKTYISIDTWHSKTAKSVLKNGFKNNLNVNIINDISGCQWDKELINVLVDYQPGYVLMYNSASPLEMFPENRHIFKSEILNNKVKAEILTKIKNYFEMQLERLTKAGLKENHIILDPGIGFAKTIAEDLTILANLDTLQCLGRPILIGVSMKSLFGKLFNILPEQTATRSLATSLLTLLTAQYGAIWHRAHNIYDIKITINMLEILQKYSLQK